ncbi:MAG: hypothetical protein IT266_00725 [Saprospiraceae bacterium]|nr:hypothetical protein [Saprospiraceae bacterium]
MITTEQLDACVEHFHAHPDSFEKQMTQLQTVQPDLAAILLNTNAELLSDEELDYLLFLFLILLSSYERQGPLPVFTAEEVITSEEASWKVINDHNDYDQAVEKFYRQLKNQDVVEYIDLAIAPDEESEIAISDPGRLVLLTVLSALARLLEDARSHGVPPSAT